MLTRAGTGVKRLMASLPAGDPLARMHALMAAIAGVGELRNRGQPCRLDRRGYVGCRPRRLSGHGACHGDMAPRAGGLPARYVSGYLALDQEQHQSQQGPRAGPKSGTAPVGQRGQPMPGPRCIWPIWAGSGSTRRTPSAPTHVTSASRQGWTMPRPRLYPGHASALRASACRWPSRWRRCSSKGDQDLTYCVGLKLDRGLVFMSRHPDECRRGQHLDLPQDVHLGG